MWRPFFRSTLMAGILLLPSDLYAQSEGWQVGATPTFSTGKYGTDIRTEIVYTPVLARRLFPDGDLTLVVPHLCITGDGSVAVVSGTPVRATTASDVSTTRERAAARAGVAAPATRGSVDTAARTRGRICGFGDIVVRGRYYLLDERGWMPTLAIRGHLKAPTADAERGLGTGRPDEGVALEVSRMLGQGFVVMADGGYTFMGKPEGLEFRNAWWYDVGVAQDLAGGVVNVSVFFEQYRSVISDFADARGVLLTLGLRSTRGWRIQVSGERGLSDGAPDHGITLGASRRF